MITRHETHLDKIDVWSALAAPLPPGVISWRQDGRTIARDGRFLARFVAYIEANTVRERLDSVVPGEWDLTLEPLPPVAGTIDDDANMGACNFKARLQILGVIRECVGTGKDWKQASTDAMKRVGVRFGIGHELYDYEHNWVQMDGDGKFARPVEDPAVAYARRYGRPKPAVTGGEGAARPTTSGNGTPAPSSTTGSPAPSPAPSPERETVAGDTVRTTDEPACPKCGGRVWDNRLTKRNPKAPDWKCRDRSCDGVIWPPKGEGNGAAAPAKQAPEEIEEIPF